MRVIISPAKKMRVNSDDLPAACEPVFLQRAQQIKAWLMSMSLEEQQNLWGCSERLARESREMLLAGDLQSALTPAILAYDGIQYQYMASGVFEQAQYDYLEEHLRILSGLYGVLRPLDKVAPYRLEMQAKGAPGSAANLYEYWGDALYREVKDESGVIINLASLEYARCISRYVTSEDRFITCVFGELSCSDKVVQKGVYAKMARGEMVRFMAEKQAKDPETLKSFQTGGYVFDERRSDENVFVFIRRTR